MMYDLTHIHKIIMPKGVGVDQIAIPIPKECKSLIELCIKDGKLCVRDGEIIVRDINIPLSETCIGYLNGKRYLLYRAILDSTIVMTIKKEKLMINPSVKEKIKNVVHKNFQFDDKGNVIETSITVDATSNAIKEMHNIVMGENND